MADKETQPVEETKEESKNIIAVSDAGPCKKKVEIEIPAEVIHGKLDEKYKELRRDAVVPGFRKGRTPIRLLEKRFGTDITQQVKLELMATASEEAIKDNDIDSLRDPDIDHEEIELPEDGPLKFEFEVEVRPEFDLPELESIAVEKTKVEATDDRVNEELAALQKRAGVWTPKETGGAAEGDQVIADVVLVTEGAADHDKRENIEIAVRENGFVAGIAVDGLDKLLKDAKGGDEKKITVDVPATYFNEDYRGKKVEVTLSVKEVKRMEPAELNDEFFKRLNVDDVDDLKDNLREQISQQAERQVRAAMSEQIYTYLKEKTTLDLPESVVAEQSSSILQRQYSNMVMQGMAKEQVDEQMDQLRASSEEQAAEQLKLYFVMDKIADKLEVEVSEEEINGHIAYVAATRGRRPEKMREELARDGSLAQFALQVREEKCIEKLLEKAAVTEVEPKKPAAKKKTAKKKTTRKKEADKDDSEAKKPIAKKKTAKKKTAKKKDE
ncbi:MAG: trigger factor [Planctomycetota bacterium]|nr:MAG: trigger factor [Planctomycetota bacterium]